MKRHSKLLLPSRSRSAKTAISAGLILAAFSFGLLHASSAQAQDQAQAQGPNAQQMPPEIRADIARGMAYPLPEDFLTRARDTLLALRSAGVQPPGTTGMSLSQTITTMDGIPGLIPILAAHGFTAETFVMGMTAFGMTLAATNGQPLPAGFPQPNPQNVTLFHAHPQDVATLMQAMGTPPSAQEQSQQ